MLSQRLRRRVLPLLDPLVRELGHYTAYQLDEGEFVGVVDKTVEETREALRAQGYAPVYKAAAKRHPEDEARIDAGSFRRVPSEHPDVDAALTREWRPVDCQYHVHLFPRDGRVVELYSHYELRSDFLAPELDIQRLRTHYRPDWGEQYLRGVLDPDLAELIDTVS